MIKDCKDVKMEKVLRWFIKKSQLKLGRVSV